MTFGGKSINHPRSAAGRRRRHHRHAAAAAAYLRRLIRRRRCRRARVVPWLLVAWFWLCGWQPGMRVERGEGEFEIGK